MLIQSLVPLAIIVSKIWVFKQTDKRTNGHTDGQTLLELLLILIENLSSLCCLPRLLLLIFGWHKVIIPFYPLSRGYKMSLGFLKVASEVLHLTLSTWKALFLFSISCSARLYYI